jgi:hypothetical protein
MPSFSVGFAQVEERLRIVRRRLNLLTLQDAIYRSGSLVALAAALLVALAMRGGTSFFAVAVWAAAAAVAAAIAAAGLRIRRHWLSRDQVARFADRQAGLDDRLTTLLDPRRRPSRLHGLLLEQIFAATPRWDVDTLAPRRVPRSLPILAASLAALLFTSYFARAPATPRSAATLPPHVNSMKTEAAGPSRGLESGRADAPDPARAVSALQAVGVAGADTAAAHPSSVAFRNAGSEPGAPASGATADSPRADRSGSRDAGALRQSDDAAPGMANKLQDAIRKALGAHDTGGAQPGTPPGAQARGTSEQDRGTNPHSDSGAGARREGTDSTRPAATSATTQPPSASSNLPGSGSAATAGARGAPAGGLFGSPTEAHLPIGRSQNVAVSLGALSTVAPSGAEPQRQDFPVGDAAGADAHAPASPADEQIPDAPLQKAEVAPEHEALIRRIFTRDE